MPAPAQSLPPFIATAPAGSAQRRIALVAVLILVAAFGVTLPFVRMPLTRMDAFIPSYESALALNDLMTAVLLFGQVATLERRGLLALAAGYLFTSSIAVVHMLSYPGVFAPAGLLGAGPQTTAWLYMFWHGGFPLAVMAYAWLDRRAIQAPLRVRTAIAAAVTLVAMTVAVLALVAFRGAAALPTIMQGDHYTPTMTAVVFTVVALPIVGLVVLWTKPRRSLLDLWLAVVLCAWTFDIALSAALNAGRFDLGFYAGRIYGLLAASFVLVMLLAEMTALYARSARHYEADRAERERRLRQVEAELTHVSRVNELGHMVSGLAHEVNQPLTAASVFAAASRQYLARGDIENARANLDAIAGQIERTVAITRHIRQFGRRRETELRLEELAGVVDEAVALALAGPGGRTVRIVTRGFPAAPIPLDRIQIQQVLLNLVRNAIEAMAESATREIVIAAALAAGDQIEISVADTGPGLAAEVRAKLFQPFVTTKSEGMGIGLSICRSIVENHGGRMWATENPAGGTVFHFTLPAKMADAGPQCSAAS